ncbi:MAG: hypothetical protein ACRCTQ_04855 [Brevinemataceae bacterium]
MKNFYFAILLLLHSSYLYSAQFPLGYQTLQNSTNGVTYSYISSGADVLTIELGMVNLNELMKISGITESQILSGYTGDDYEFTSSIFTQINHQKFLGLVLFRIESDIKKTYFAEKLLIKNKTKTFEYFISPQDVSQGIITTGRIMETSFIAFMTENLQTNSVISIQYTNNQGSVTNKNILPARMKRVKYLLDYSNNSINSFVEEIVQKIVRVVFQIV